MEGTAHPWTCAPVSTPVKQCPQHRNRPSAPSAIPCPVLFHQAEQLPSGAHQEWGF